MKSCPPGSPKPRTVEHPPNKPHRFKIPVRPRLSLTTNRVSAKALCGPTNNRNSSVRQLQKGRDLLCPETLFSD